MNRWSSCAGQYLAIDRWREQGEDGGEELCIKIKKEKTASMRMRMKMREKFELREKARSCISGVEGGKMDN